MTRRAAACAVLILMAGAARLSGAAAATADTQLQIESAVSDACVLGTAPMALGTYAARTIHAASPLDFAGTITLDCVAGTSARLSLDDGQNPAAGSTDAAPLRRMSDGSEHIDYNLYSDAARTSVWGTGAAGEPAPVNTFPSALSIYGRVPPGQATSPGNYTDTVLLTASF
ncbi:MAG: spore coat U domain-containing protein [Myxococcales bacterium]|nr:spore coat U domain-containing protein [Myxococcales bacterium]